MKRLIAVLLCVALACSMTACGKSDSTGGGAAAPATTSAAGSASAETAAETTKVPDKIYTMNCGISIASGTPREESCDVCYAESFKEYVEEHSGGAIKFDIFYGNSLGSDADVVAGLSNGSVEFYCGDITTVSSYYNPALLFSIPGAIGSIEEANRLFDSEWGQKFFDECAAASGIRILCSVGKGFRNFTTVKHPIKTVDDVAGLSFRVLNNPLYIRMVESLSASAVPMDISELYTALQNGVVDGHENSIPNILQDKTYEVEKHLVLDAHTGSYFCGMISDSFYLSLPEDLQKVVQEANEYAKEKVKEAANNILVNGIETLRENGVEVYEPTDEELDAWHAAYADACMELAKEQIGETVVEDFVAAVARYGKQ